MDIWERLRYARDRALEAEQTERQRLADADTVDLQQAASVRLATRQAVREALDDVLDESSEPERASAAGSTTADADPEQDVSEGDSAGNEAAAGEAAQAGDVAEDPTGSLAGTSTQADDAEMSYAGAGSPEGEDVQRAPGSQSDG